MTDQVMSFFRPHRVNFETLQKIVKNPDPSNSVAVLVKGTATIGDRRLAGHAGVSRKFMFKFGF